MQTILVVDSFRCVILHVVHGWIVPLLSFARAENNIKCGANDVNGSCDHKNYAPLADCWLKINEKKLFTEHVANDYRFTFPSMMLPATMGARRPKKFAKQFVNDIRIPAKRGVRSR